MTVSSTTNRKEYAGNGVTTSFSTSPVVFFASGDLTVYVVSSTGTVTTLTENTHYTVSGGGTSPAIGAISTAGGSSPYGAPATGTTLVIVRDLDIVQETDFVQNDGSDANVSEAALDRAAIISQQLGARIDRSVRLADSDVSGAALEIPTPEANSIFGWNAAGTALVNYIVQAGTSLVDLAASTGASLIGFIVSAAGAVATTVRAELLRLPYTPQQFGAVGDGVTNDTVAWTAWNTAVAASTSRRGYIPGGTYLIDSWIVNTPGVHFDGANVGVTGSSVGAKIKCRADIAKFVDFSGAYASSLNNVEIDGNNHATTTFAITTQTYAFTSSKVTVGGCVNNGINCDLSGTTTNTQVAEMTFIDWLFAGRGSRSSGSGIINLKVNSDQTLVMTFVRPMFGGFAVSGDVDTHAFIRLGTVTMYTPFWTNAATYDLRVGNAGIGGGSVTLVDGRSESSTADSIYVDGGSGDVTLINYVHATTTKTTLTATTNFTGRAVVIGGQYNIVNNSSATAEIAMFNHKQFGTGSYAGTYANRICKLEAGTMQMRQLAVQAAAGTLATLTDTTNAKVFYVNWVNNVLTLFRDGPAELCNWDTNGVLTQQAALKVKDKIYPGTDAGATQTAAGLYAGSGAPSNANGSNGDFYFRSDGTQAANTVIYHKQAGAWVALITT